MPRQRETIEHKKLMRQLWLARTRDARLAKYRAEHPIKPIVIPKSQVCITCKKRKKIKHFYYQKPPYVAKIAKRKPGIRRDCKKCHYEKSREAYLKRTTVEQRRVYMTNYFRQRNNVLPTGYRVNIAA